MKAALAGVILMALSASATAGCPPLSAYRVTEAGVRGAPAQDAIALLLEGTAWRAEVGEGLANTVSFSGVTGPLDRVLERLIREFNSNGRSVAMVQDIEACVVRVNVRQPVTGNGSPAMATRVIESELTQPVATVEPEVPVELPPPADMRPHILAKGLRLSEALHQYAGARGWDLRWLIEEDYIIDVDVPIPAVDVIDGVTWVVQAYQSQGGLRGVTPRFARGNSVAVIEKMDVRESAR